MPPLHSEEDVFAKAKSIAAKYGIKAESPYIYKKSLDARRKKDIHFVYSVVMCTRDTESKTMPPEIKPFDENIVFESGKSQSAKKVLVVGSGPCGLFAAYVLSKGGLDVIVVERGSSVDERCKKVKRFWETGLLDTECNIQFGEGGAGTFSDGKLNTRIGSPLQGFVLKTFVENGAPKEILYDAKPHIGTDLLSGCVKNIREKIKANGGQVFFDTCLTDIDVKDGKVIGAILNGSAYIDCDAIILAPGHSSRDTYKMLESRGVIMEQKPFAAGVRIEHSREFINEMQYGNLAHRNILPTADYRLTHNGVDRSVYSFCMCPGGTVVNASSEDGYLCVNGMSENARMADNSNSALVVTVRPEDFEENSPLAGVEFQRKYEKAAYSLAAGRGPVQLARDFVKNRVSDAFDGVKPSFTGQTEFVDLRECLPEFISNTLEEGLLTFDKKIKGFSSYGAVLTGVEMRTSAPLRIKRNENFESLSHKGLFPGGEGAGYAGGIMSAAVDGIRIAERILEMTKEN
ncbi:MAG: FAD-dependent oxidoreductase [Clostridia bacterium]|nr:FAD-dependent oxidoreductase [Clostridia bacterium]